MCFDFRFAVGLISLNSVPKQWEVSEEPPRCYINLLMALVLLISTWTPGPYSTDDVNI